MPKQSHSLHFDPLGLLKGVAEQDFGLHVTTNNPEGFRRIMYAHMRAAPHLRCRIFASPLSKQRFILLKPSVAVNADTPELKEPRDDEAER